MSLIFIAPFFAGLFKSRISRKLSLRKISNDKVQPTDVTFWTLWRTHVFSERSVRGSDGGEKALTIVILLTCGRMLLESGAMVAKKLLVNDKITACVKEICHDHPIAVSNVEWKNVWWNILLSWKRKWTSVILVNILASFFSIALNWGSCQIIILMNMLVIIAIKTRRRLQSTCNILLLV